MQNPVSATILVIDDNEGIAQLVNLVLEDDGYRVINASDGSEALRLVEACQPALILLDLRMPVMSGREFLRRLRETAGPHPPVVVMSGALLTRQQAVDLQVDGVLMKPFEITDLLATVERLVRQRLEAE